MKTILSAIAVSAMALLGSPGSGEAETVGYAQAIRALTAACGADIENNCRGVKPGGGAIANCLASKPVSQQCASTAQITFDLLAKRAAAQDNAAKVCAGDARRLCSDFREGGGRILLCMTRSDIYPRISKKCKAAITDAGWR